MGRRSHLKEPYTREYLLKKLLEASQAFGPTISTREMASLGIYPAKAQYQKFFGSFNKAKEIAGLIILPVNGNWQKLKLKNYKGGKGHGGNGFLRLRFKIFERDNFTCQYCGRSPEDGAKLEIDHVIPRSKSGLNDESNFVTACFDCNRGKRDHLLSPKKKNPAQEI